LYFYICVVYTVKIVIDYFNSYEECKCYSLCYV
jgi:hypothetical protein